MTGIPSSGLVDHLDELRPLDPALEQRVDEDDIGPQLLDRRDGARAVAQDLEQLHPRLGVEQTADVLGDLWDVLDDEQSRLIGRWHRPDDTTRVGGGTHPEVRVGGWPDGADQARTASRIARSLPGPSRPIS